MKSLILIFFISVLFTPCFAEGTRYRLQGNGFVGSGWIVVNEKLKGYANSGIKTGWIVSEEELKGYVDSNIHPGYGFSDTVVKDGQMIIKIGSGNLVFPDGVKTVKDITGQGFKGKVIMFNNYYAPHGASWSDVVRMYEGAGLMPDSVKAKEMGVKVYSFPLSYFSYGRGEAFAKVLMDGDGPGNGGGSPSASMKIYFSEEAISQAQMQQFKARLAEEGGAFVMAPFYGMNYILENEAAFFEGKKVLREDAFQNHWGMMPNEDVQNELLKRLLERAGFMEEFEEVRDALTAHGWNEAPDMEVGFMFHVPESYLREKTGMAYEDYDKGVPFMIGIPQSSFGKKARAIYGGYGEMGVFQQGIGGGLPDYATGLSSGY